MIVAICSVVHQGDEFGSCHGDSADCLRLGNPIFGSQMNALACPFEIDFGCPAKFHRANS